MASRVPTAAGSTLTFLLTEAVAVAAVAVWSRRPGWSQLHVLVLAAAALFAYAWHAFTTTPAFDTAPIAVVRVSNVVFVAMALAAVLLAGRRLARSS
jgi:drug/metabolite transporter (DMT)-like permease